MHFNFLTVFWNKIDKTPGHGPYGDCWLWTGYKGTHGYGVVRLRNVAVSASRVSYELTTGNELSDSINLRRICKIPACCNPSHFRFVNRGHERGKHAPNFIDLTGKRFGRLVVLSLSHRSNGRYILWTCRCDCGTVKDIAGQTIRRGHSKTKENESNI